MIEPIERVPIDAGDELTTWCVLVNLLTAHLLVAQGIEDDIGEAYDLCDAATDFNPIPDEYCNWPGVSDFVDDIVSRGWVNITQVDADYDASPPVEFAEWPR